MHTLWLFYSTYTEIKPCHSKCSPNPTITKLRRLSFPIHFCSALVSWSLCSMQWGRRHGEIEWNQAESAFPSGLFTHIICILGTLFPPPAPFPHKERPPRVVFTRHGVTPKGSNPQHPWFRRNKIQLSSSQVCRIGDVLPLNVVKRPRRGIPHPYTSLGLPAPRGSPGCSGRLSPRSAVSPTRLPGLSFPVHT